MLKNQLSFSKMIETQLAQIAALLPAVENGKILGQPEAPVENVSMVSTGWGNPSRRSSCTNHAGRHNPPKNDSWDGLVAAVQEDLGVTMISCSIYHKYYEQLLAFLKSIPGLQRPRQQPQNCLLAVLSAITRNEGAEPILATAPKGCHSRGIIYTITDGSASARIYRCSISPRE